MKPRVVVKSIKFHPEGTIKPIRFFYNPLSSLTFSHVPFLEYQQAKNDWMLVLQPLYSTLRATGELAAASGKLKQQDLMIFMPQHRKTNQRFLETESVNASERRRAVRKPFIIRRSCLFVRVSINSHKSASATVKCYTAESWWEFMCSSVQGKDRTVSKTDCMGIMEILGSF